MAKKKQHTVWREDGILGILVLALWSAGRIADVVSASSLYALLHVLVFIYASILIVRWTRAKGTRPLWEVMLYVYVCLALIASLYFVAYNFALSTPIEQASSPSSH